MSPREPGEQRVPRVVADLRRWRAERRFVIGLSGRSEDDEDIRAVLDALPPVRFVRTSPPGLVVISQAAVEDVGLDLDAVERWVRRRGGYAGMSLKRLPPRDGEPVRRRGPLRYFAVPADALERHAARGPRQPSDTSP